MNWKGSAQSACQRAALNRRMKRRRRGWWWWKRRGRERWLEKVRPAVTCSGRGRSRLTSEVQQAPKLLDLCLRSTPGNFQVFSTCFSFLPWPLKTAATALTRLFPPRPPPSHPALKLHLGSFVLSPAVSLVGWSEPWIIKMTRRFSTGWEGLGPNRRDGESLHSFTSPPYWNCRVRYRPLTFH